MIASREEIAAILHGQKSAESRYRSMISCKLFLSASGILTDVSSFIQGVKARRSISFGKTRQSVSMDIDHFVVPSESPCGGDIRYRSMIALGRAECIEDREEKQRALCLITAHYGCAETPIFTTFTRAVEGDSGEDPPDDRTDIGILIEAHGRLYLLFEGVVLPVPHPSPIPRALGVGDNIHHAVSPRARRIGSRRRTLLLRPGRRR